MDSCLRTESVDERLFVGEITFAIVIGVLGLVLFGQLIGNMQVSQCNSAMHACMDRQSVATILCYFFNR
jgi:hypothetical protein